MGVLVLAMIGQVWHRPIHLMGIPCDIERGHSNIIQGFVLILRDVVFKDSNLMNKIRILRFGPI